MTLLYSVYKFIKLLFIEKINMVNIIDKIISLNLKKDFFENNFNKYYTY